MGSGYTMQVRNHEILPLKQKNEHCWKQIGTEVKEGKTMFYFMKSEVKVE